MNWVAVLNTNIYFFFEQCLKNEKKKIKILWTVKIVIEFAIAQMWLQLTKSVIFSGVCCFDSQLFTFHNEHYSLFSCKGKVKGRMTGFDQVTAFLT